MQRGCVNTTMMLMLRVHIRCYTLVAQCQLLPLLARIKGESTYQVSCYWYAATMSLICHGVVWGVPGAI